MKKKVVGLFLVSLLIISISAKTYAKEGVLGLSAFKEGYQFTAVEGDKGRYREDRYITDDYIGGIEELILSGTRQDTSLTVDLRAIYDYDYGINLDLTKGDNYYLKFNSQQMRRYYDGSNEAWDPSLYNLADEFADREDGHMYVDRLRATFETGFFLDNAPDISFGWDRWGRDGEETLLRGARARATGLVDLRSIPAYSQVQGWSDTFFVKLEETFADKYNVSLKQEFERYRDNQRIIFPRYNNGSVEEFRTFEDQPSFTEALTHFSFNSFLSKKTYLTVNYLYQNLKNTTLRSVIRPDTAPTYFTDPSVNNRRKANIINLGMVFIDGMVKDLRWGFNLRAERATTKSEGRGFRSGTLRISESEQEEENYAETVSLTYTGIKNATLSYVLELEQRDLNWNQYADVRSYEVSPSIGVDFISRDTAISHNDFISTLQASLRPNRKTKISAKYRKTVKRRGYEDLRDNSESFYPGYMGSSRQDTNQYSLRLNLGPYESWLLGLEFVGEEGKLGYAFQNGVDGQKTMRNRLSANLTGSLSDELTLSLMAMGEDFELDTPGSGTAANLASGESAYDYDADMYLLSATGNYRISKKASSYLTLQHTEVTGTVSNNLDELWLGANYRWDEGKKIDGRLELFNFDDESGEGFDNYKGITLYLSYNRQF